jgi:riboflavin kinase/FMN adenylyltransferase
VDTQIQGTVIHGDHRGRKLGFPTANVRLSPDDPPLRYGVYAGYVDGLPAAISVGVRPTFGDSLEPLLEAFILDWDGDLYGHTINVRLRGMIRGELKFEGEATLIAEMHRDVDRVRESLAGFEAAS